MRRLIRNLILAGSLLATAFWGCYYWNFARGRAKTTTEVPQGFFVAGEVVSDWLGSAEYNPVGGGTPWVYGMTLKDEKGEWWDCNILIYSPFSDHPGRSYVNLERSILPGDVAVVKGNGRMNMNKSLNGDYFVPDGEPQDVMKLEGRLKKEFLAKMEKAIQKQKK